MEYEPYFFCIGAQKSGTTALHEIFKNSNELCLSEFYKENPYFTEPDRIQEGWRKHLDKFYDLQVSGKIGSFTPQYMYHPDIANRIKQVFPDVKILIILRDPISRAVSHYRMCLKRGIETRKLDKALFQELNLEKLSNSRDTIPQRGQTALEVNNYIAWSEYGRILEKYFELFSQNKIKVIFSSSLKNDATNTLIEICDFLEIDSDFICSITNKEHHVTRTSFWDIYINRFEKFVTQLKLRKIIPSALKCKYRQQRDGIRKRSHNIVLSNKLRKELANHFIADAQRLKFDVPWLTEYKSYLKL